MKKSFRILLTLVLAFVMVLSLTACASDCEKGKHSFVEIDAIEATCTSAGRIAHNHCLVCDLYFDANGKQITQQETVVPALGHDLSETAATAPTCTADGNIQYWECGRCDKKFSDANGATEITNVVANKTGHVNIIAVSQVPATCTTAGTLAHEKCADCDALFVDDEQVTASDLVIAVDENAHAWDGGVVTTPATCTTEGVKTFTCQHNAEHTKTENVEIDETAHTVVDDPAVDATCAETGLTAGSHCSACNEVIVAQQIVPATGHTEVVDPAVSSTCTATGLTEGKHCTVCNQVTVAQQTVSATGHTKQTIPAVAPSCTETGLTAGEKCSVCGEITLEQEEVESLGHTKVAIPAVVPTCTTEGKTAGEKCSVCDTVITAQDTVEVLAHTEVIDVAVPATCTTAGKTEGKHCSVCNEVILAQQVVPATGHDWDDGVVTTAPTCSKVGVKSFTCQNDKSHTKTEDVAINATAHAWGEWTQTKAPTCSEKGVETRVCAHNVEHKETREVAIDANAHKWNDGVVTTAPTCSEVGVKTYTCQLNDAHTKTEDVAIDPTAHNLVHHDAKAETCEEGEKWWDAYDTCSRCDYSTKVEKDPVAHTPVVDEAVEPTCEQTGLTEGSHCSKCNKVLVEQKVDPSLGHTYGELVAKVPATCEETGMDEHFRCTVCQGYFRNDANKTKTTAKALELPVDTKDGHSWQNEEGKPATCTEAGYTAYRKCELCETEDGKTTLTATNHNYGTLVVKVPATCTSTGRDAHYLCDNCDTYFTSAKVQTTWDALLLEKDANAHKKSATWSNDAEGHYHVCENGCDQKLDYTAHNVVVDQASDPTCTTTGKSKGSHCDVCQRVIVSQTEVPKLGHKPAVAYTPTQDGSKHYHVCENGCGAILDAEDHRPEVLPGSNPTCTESGLTQGSKCKDCNYIITAQTTRPATGHTYGSLVVEKPATCSATGIDAHFRCTVCEGYFQNDAQKTPTTLVDLALPVNPNAHTLVHTGTFDDEKHYGAHCQDCDYTTDAEAHYGQGEWLHETVDETIYHYQLCSCGYTGKLNRNACVGGDPIDENVVPATCTTPGSKDVVVYCTTCKHEISRQTNVEIPVIAHSYEQVEDNKFLVTPATCTTLAVYKESCSCGAMSETTFNGSKLAPHTYSEVVNKHAATCKEAGMEAHFRCTVCEGYFQNDASKTPTTEQDLVIVIDDVNGHKWQDVKEKSATCTEDGYSAHKLCTLCGKTSAKETYNKKGHTEVIDEAVESTCTQTGLTQGVHCSECGVELVKQEITSKKDHAYGELQPAVEPTCQKGGNVAYYQCDDCKAYFTEGKQQVNAFSDLQLAAVPTAHTFDHLRAKVPATCTTTGTKAYKDCIHCGEHFDAEGNHLDDITLAIDANAHAWGEWTQTTAPTCSAVGEDIRVCAHNNSHTDTRDVAIDSNAHAWNDGAVTTAPTCTKAGVRTFTCTHNAEHKRTEAIEIDANAHAWGEWQTTTPATCTAEGTATRTCTHNTEHKQTQSISIVADAHDWDEGVVTTAPTCTEKGLKTYTCKHNAEHNYTEVLEVDPTAHNYGEWTQTTAPTCSAVGEETRTCSHNVDHKETREVEANGHVYGQLVDEQPATCENAGMQAYYFCDVCDNYFTSEKVETTKQALTISALGHDEIAHEGKPATCKESEKWWEAYVTCSRCDYSTKVENDPVDHTPVTDEAKAPTCTETGLTEGSHCDVCGKVIVEQTEVDSLGHDEIAHEAKAATCTEKGHKAYVTCSRCDHTTYEEIPSLGHKAAEAWSTDEDSHWKVCENGCGVKQDLGDHVESVKFDTEGHWAECSTCGIELLAKTAHTVSGGECTLDGCPHIQATSNVTLTSIPDAVAIAEEIGTGNTTQDIHYILGRIESIDNDMYGNMYIQDADGNQLYIYGLYTYDGVRYDSMSTKPVVGDIVVIYGAINNYNETAQLKNATLWEHNGAPEITAQVIADDITISSTAEFNFDLPTTTYGTITWASNNSVITIDGNTAVVNASKKGDTAVTLTATVVYNGETVTKTFDVTVPKYIEKKIEEFVAADQSYGNAQKISSAESGEVTFKFTDGTKTATAYYTTGEGIRVYYGGTMTVVAPGAITQITISFGSGDKTNAITVNCGSWDEMTDTWTGSAESVTFTIGGTSDHRRIAKITVIYVAPCEHTSTGDPVHVENETQHQLVCDECGETYLEDHSFAPVKVDDTYHKLTCDCGFEKSTEEHHYTSDHECSCGHKEPTYTVTVNGVEYSLSVNGEIVDTNAFYIDTEITLTITLPEGKVVDTVTQNDQTIEWTGSHTFTLAGNTTFTFTLKDKPVDCAHNNLGDPVYVDETLHESTCLGCGLVVTATHSHNAVVTVPTCTEQGCTTHTCACGDTYVNTYVDATGHNYTATVTAPTCTEQGYTTHTCTVCGDNYVDTYVDETGHKFVDKGNCSVCEAPYPYGSAEVTISFADTTHRDSQADESQVWSNGGVTFTNNKSASTNAVVSNTNPVRLYANSEIVVKATGITKIVFDCNSNSYATALNNSISDATVTVDSDKIIITFVAPVDEYKIAKLSAQVRMDSMTVTMEVDCPHPYTTVTTQDATCTEAGKTITTCNYCGEVIKTETVGDPLGHQWGEWTQTTAPQCEVAGEETRECSVCDATETQAVDALDHTEVIDKAVSATCTETGLTEGKHCSVCEKVLIEQEETPATGHSDSDRDNLCDNCGTTMASCSHENTTVTCTATCTEVGFTRETCDDCSSLISEEETVALGHNMDNGKVTTPVTCEVDGVKTFTCQRENCGHTTTETIQAVGHTEKTLDAVAPTCTETGLTVGVMCTSCDKILTAQTEVPATGHTFVNGVCACGELAPAEPVATFEFGANGTASHSDGSNATSYSETNNSYTLTLSSLSNVYKNARDAKGASCLKLGASSKAGSFSFTVSADVNKVVIYITGYKENTAKITVNGTSHTISTLSNNGAYTAIEIDTSTNKTVTFTTASGGWRAMLNTIEFWA